MSENVPREIHLLQSDRANKYTFLILTVYNLDTHIINLELRNFKTL